MAPYVLHDAVYAAAPTPSARSRIASGPGRLLVVGYVAETLTAVLAVVARASIAVLAPVFVAGGLTLAFEDTLEGTIAAVESPRELRGSGLAPSRP